MSHTIAKNGYFGEKVVCKDRPIAREPKEIRKIGFALFRKSQIERAQNFLSDEC